ncbi:hypothetical protein MS2017_1345 [Bathymodiolus thermophilus thioautotrophic gill symbiont]|uniref:Uncharacterized protein n=1 Tax=Bathymodiolus thermophilus thioautotrophic gill symbiont TaxID=2360 RepID=A0A3G3IMM2_9GAMM|nr:hypothetical protein [Bathymodiolus thermophilus thioautotrophic gill symbiont]AYQ57035.1 hypothetical protein MS2017_1345 [Bathymodiolus thermophilus thioautotrophic gill symbiont]
MKDRTQEIYKKMIDMEKKFNTSKETVDLIRVFIDLNYGIYDILAAIDLLHIQKRTDKIEIKFLKHSIKVDGKNYRCYYFPNLMDTGKIGIQITGKNYKRLPKILNPKNESDAMTDYFENDRVFIEQGTKYFKAVLKQALRIKYNQSDVNLEFAKNY